MGRFLLQVNNLKTYFYVKNGLIKAVDDLNIKIKKGDTLGIIGESGCGKSATALSILRLIQEPPGRIVGGEILLNEDDLLRKSSEEIRNIRGNKISMIFQDPSTSLNPLYTVGNQISESILIGQKLSKATVLLRAINVLNSVGLSPANMIIHKYPHELSGGQKQRVMIAIALSHNPYLLIADEPTTALDVTIQAQILELLKQKKNEFGMSILIITHDLGVIAEISDNVAVVYAGKEVEYADVLTIFKNPLHPYTMALHNSIPRITDKIGKKLEVIQGEIPDPLSPPTGCKFHPRCKFAINLCKEEEPYIMNISNNHLVRCWMYEKERERYFKNEKAIAR